MSMHRYANGGPIMAGLAAMDAAIEPMPAKAEPFSADELYHMMEGLSEQIGELAAHIGEIRQRLASVENATMPQDMDAVLKRMKPQPIAWCAEEGGEWEPWVQGEGGVFHAIVLDDGSVFDAFNGWRSRVYEADALALIKSAAAANSARRRLAGIERAKNLVYRQMVDNAYAAGVGQQRLQWFQGVDGVSYAGIAGRQQELGAAGNQLRGIVKAQAAGVECGPLMSVRTYAGYEPVVKRMLEQKTREGGVFAVEQWPDEGSVLWYHGQIKWKEWEDGAKDYTFAFCDDQDRARMVRWNAALRTWSID